MRYISISKIPKNKKKDTYSEKERKEYMKSDGLMIFENPEFGTVRTAMINGRIYFAGVDVARALGYSNTRDAISRHCKGVVKHDGVIQSTGQVVEMSFITEGDVYRLIMRSQLPSAEKFEIWVCDEVLPSLRENGTYNISSRRPDSYMIEDSVERAKRWIEEQEEKKALEVKLEEQAPQGHGLREDD